MFEFGKRRRVSERLRQTCRWRIARLGGPQQAWHSSLRWSELCPFISRRVPSTVNVVIVADTTDSAVSRCLNCFGKDFDVCEAAIRIARRRKCCFNRIHIPKSFGVNVVLSRQRPCDVSARNRGPVEHPGEAHSLAIHMATTGDAVISKLMWYRRTNETSDGQRDDVNRLLKSQSAAADVEYVRESAWSRGVEELSARQLSRGTRHLCVSAGPSGACARFARKKTAEGWRSSASPSRTAAEFPSAPSSISMRESSS